MKIELTDDQQEVLGRIRNQMNDEWLCDNIEYYYNTANQYNFIKKIGQYGVWVKLKNNQLFHVLSVDVNFFLSEPLIKINMQNHTKKFKKLLVSPILEWNDLGHTWWVNKPQGGEDD